MISDSPIDTTTTVRGDPINYIGVSLTDALKIELLNEKWKPPANFVFQPVTVGRKYNICWEQQHSWLRYSVSKDKAFCAYCILFGEKPNKRGMHSAENFQKFGFCQWKNATGAKRGALLTHERSEIHSFSASRASCFRDTFSGRSRDIQSSLSEAYKEQVVKNRSVLLSIIDVIIALGKRNIPFRGHAWDKVTKREDGNFDFFVHWKSEFDSILREHLDHAPGNAKYMSPAIQNELITLVGLEIRDSILENIKAAKWYSIMADESTDSATIEQMSFCTRFLDHSSDQPIVREEFISLVQLDSTDAESISAAILRKLNECDLDLGYLRGQGYDGASHCRAHNLNLVISSSCKQIPEIRSLFDSLSALTWFLGASPKRRVILKRHLKSNDISDQ